MKREILKVTVLKNKGVNVKYRGERDKKKTPHEVTEKIKADPESDFEQAMKRMGGYAVKTSALGYAEHALNQDKLTDQIATPDKPTVLKSVLSYVSKAIRVDTVVFGWKDDEVNSIKVTGTFTNHINETTPIETPTIMLHERNYGFEASLVKDVEKLLQAIGSYLKGSYTQIVPDELPEVQPMPKLGGSEPQDGEEDMAKTTMQVVDKKTAKAA